MPDIRKTNLGLFVWTEDLVKFRAHHKGSVGGVSTFIRDLFHREMTKLSLTPKCKRELAASIARAKDKREARRKTAKENGKAKVVDALSAMQVASKGRSGYGTSTIAIPKAVRKGVKFVRA